MASPKAPHLTAPQAIKATTQQHTTPRSIRDKDSNGGLGV